MRGTWLTAIARRVTRRETFDSLVAPALADLQYESAARRPVRRHYAAFVIVIATAILRDLRTDVHLTFTATRVWRRTAVWWAGFGAFFIWAVTYADTPWHLLDAVGRATALAYAVAVGVINALPFALAAAVFYLRRQSTAPRRAIAVAAVTFVAAAAALNLTASALRPATNRILVDSVSRVVAEQRPGASLDDRAGYKDRWRNWLETRRERSTQSSELAGGPGAAAVNGAFASALNLAPYAMFGLVLARGWRWTVFARVIGIVATYVLVQFITIQFHVPVLTGHGRSSDAIRQILAMFLTGTVWLLGIRLLDLPSVSLHALASVRRWVPRRSSR
jgi:hypothetical protein